MGKLKKGFISIEQLEKRITYRQTKIMTFTRNVQTQSNSMLAQLLRFSFFRNEFLSFFNLKCFKTLKLVCKEFNNILSTDISVIQRNEIFKRFVEKNRFDLIELYFVSSLPPQKLLEIDFFQTLENNPKHSTTLMKAVKLGSLKTIEWLLDINDKLKTKILSPEWISSEVLPKAFSKNRATIMKSLLNLSGVHPYYIQYDEAYDHYFQRLTHWSSVLLLCEQILRFPDLDLRNLYRWIIDEAIEDGDLEILMYLESLDPKMKTMELDSELMTRAGEQGHLDIMEWMVWMRPELRPLSFSQLEPRDSFSCSRFSEIQIIAFLESISTEPLNFTFTHEDPSNSQSNIKEIVYGYSTEESQKDPYTYTCGYGSEEDELNLLEKERKLENDRESQCFEIDDPVLEIDVDVKQEKKSKHLKAKK